MNNNNIMAAPHSQANMAGTPGAPRTGKPQISLKQPIKMSSQKKLAPVAAGGLNHLAGGAKTS